MSARSRTVSSSAPIKAALALAALAAATPACADRALLIGVGAYPALAPDLQLAAPAEDARRLRGALLRAGVPAAEIETMSDAEGVRPDRAAVLAALARLAAEVRPREQVLLYFSGHGAQAPAAVSADEPDGLAELYLMRDASAWNGGIGRVPGSISDVELETAIDAIRARGADVWLVADTCHAAGITRGGLPADVRVKAVPMAALGVPDRAPLRSEPHPATLPTTAGGFAAFYAAGPGALAVERRLPLGSPDARPLSQFSYALVRALDAGRVHSLRDLAIALNATDDALGGGAPQPIFEGALDMTVLGLPADRTRRFAAERVGAALAIAAGGEEGIEPGTRFLLHDVATGTGIGGAVAREVRLGRTLLAVDGPLPPAAIEAEPLLQVRDAAGRSAGLLAAVAPIAGGGVAQSLSVDARLWRPGPARDCPALPRSGDPPATARPVSLLALPLLGQCDVVVATVTNVGATPVDLSPFYLDAGGRLVALSFLDDGGVRVGRGERRRIAVRLLSEDKAGVPLATGGERLVLVALPADGVGPVDLRGIAAARASRGDTTIAPPPGAGALVYRWTVAPLGR